MQNRDFSDFRLLGGCKWCGARYSVFRKDAQLEFEVTGSDPDEVRSVSAEGFAAMWDDIGGPSTRPDSDSVFAAKDITEMMKQLRPDITVGVKVSRSHLVSGSHNIIESTEKTCYPRKTVLWVSLALGIVGSMIAAILLEYFGIIDIIKSLP